MFHAYRQVMLMPVPHALLTSCSQLIRRNDELALLYEKIKIQQSTLSKGQIQYRDRLNEIRVLKIKLNDLKRELHILKSSVANIDVLKKEVHQLGRELLQVRDGVQRAGCAGQPMLLLCSPCTAALHNVVHRMDAGLPACLVMPVIVCMCWFPVLVAPLRYQHPN
jgi:hypothetical protein